MNARWIFSAAALLAGAGAAAGPSAGGVLYGDGHGGLPRFATHQRTPVPCVNTPFGRHVTLGQDAEPVNLIAAGSFGALDVYAPTAPGSTPPLSRLLRASPYAGALAGTTVLDAVAVDLNGDGRDEIVTAHRVTAGGNLRLGVFRRNGTGQPELFDQWNLTLAFSTVKLVAGDFDGSGDGAQELAVYVRGTSPQTLFVHVLTGAADGGIAQADGASAGRWTRTASTVGEVSVTAGDVLLDGREQILVANWAGSGASRTSNIHVLGFQRVTTWLPLVAGDTQIGSRTFTHTDGFSYETEGGGSQTINNLDRVLAVAGDLVDTAAAELVVLTQFRASSENNYIGARLHHFTTTRDANNAITAIALASNGQGRPWDSSHFLQGQFQGSLRYFDAAVGSIDRVSPAEFIVGRADTNERLLVQAFKAQVRPGSSFTWERNGQTVTFTDQSTGPIVSREWDFGHGSGPITDANPVHIFPAPALYTVRLNVRDNQNVLHSYQTQVDTRVSGPLSGGVTAVYRYLLRTAAAYEAFHTVASAQDLHFVRVAIGDLDKNGIAEVHTVARNQGNRVLRSVWALTNTAVPTSFAGRHMEETLNEFQSMTAMAVLAPDYDGDSLLATLGADCRRVEEPQLRQVIWLPPYFDRLQSGAEKVASFGQSTSGGSSIEQRAGTFTSHDVSAHVGVSAGSELLGVEASVRATAGYNYQSSYGELHGSENTLRLDQSYSQSQGEALVVIEENTFNCFSYDVESQAGGLDPSSGVRMCEVVDGTRFLSATDAQVWDRQIPAAPANHPPAQWFPLHRDWASLSLFRPVTTNVAGAVAGNATDGRFGTGANSGTTAVAQPYLQVDLGEVRDITNIRIFPTAGNARFLRGYRIFASEQPITGNAPPAPGPTVAVFAPETGDDMAYDRWSIWTRGRIAPHTPLRARYIRLQHPASSRMHVAQIQVFGDAHAEPPSYPDAVCDPINNDGLFQALVWDPGSGANGAFRAIDVRGDMLWNGSGAMVGCTNYSGMLQANIWPSTVIGNSATSSWNLSSESSNVIGSFQGFESSTRVGAEFDLEVGFIATVQFGGAYEFTSGITEEVQTSSFWGTGLEIGGGIGGFSTPDLISVCRYNPRPYAFRLVDVSNTGYEHSAYTVDYVVRQGSGSSGLWQRGNVPVACLSDETIFANGFD